MITRAYIGAVTDYANRGAIGRVAARVFSEDEEINGLLAGGRSGRLLVIKPNWVQEQREDLAGAWTPVITHPSVVSAVLEALAEQISGTATICICDAPHTYADFATITARGELKAEIGRLRGRFPNLRIELLDLRREVWVRRDGVVVERRRNGEDPRGYVRVNLGRESHFYQHAGEGRYYGADYDATVVNAHHHGEVHEYLLAGSPMSCDLFINLPKLKTHKKTGITCCLKNLVGINGDKNWLPHHTEGGPREGGDEFPDDSWLVALERRAKRFGMKVATKAPVVGTWLYRRMRQAGLAVRGDSETTARNGNWWGNDTCWRMALDLNRALLYGRADGTLNEGQFARKYLAIVDGIIGGEGNGPLCPDAVESGVLLAGRDPAVLDAVAARLMGFDAAEIPIVARAFDPHRWPITRQSLATVRVWDEREGAEIALQDVAPAVPGGFAPHFGWRRLRKTA